VGEGGSPSYTGENINDYLNLWGRSTTENWALYKAAKREVYEQRPIVISFSPKSGTCCGNSECKDRITHRTLRLFYYKSFYHPGCLAEVDGFGVPANRFQGFGFLDKENQKLLTAIFGFDEDFDASVEDPSAILDHSPPSTTNGKCGGCFDKFTPKTLRVCFNNKIYHPGCFFESIAYNVPIQKMQGYAWLSENDKKKLEEAFISAQETDKSEDDEDADGDADGDTTEELKAKKRKL